jgi:hypothetical protein
MRSCMQKHPFDFPQKNIHSINRWISLFRDDNSGMGTQYPPGTRPDGVRYGDDFFTREWHPYLTQTETGTGRIFFLTHT